MSLSSRSSIGAGPRYWVAVLIALAVVLGTPASSVAAQPAVRPAVALAGVTESGRILGRSSAPVTLAVFSDLQCPPCTPFFLEVLPSLIPKWVDTGIVRLEYRSLETATFEPTEFEEEVSAAYAAGAQNLQWPYVESFFEEQKEEGSRYVNAAFLEQIAAGTPGLNGVAWHAHLSNPNYRREMLEDEQLASRHGIVGTPSFLIGRTGKALHLFEPNEVSARVYAGSFAHAFKSVLHSKK